MPTPSIPNGWRRLVEHACGHLRIVDPSVRVSAALVSPDGALGVFFQTTAPHAMVSEAVGFVHEHSWAVCQHCGERGILRRRPGRVHVACDGCDDLYGAPPC